MAVQRAAWEALTHYTESSGLRVSRDDFRAPDQSVSRWAPRAALRTTLARRSGYRKQRLRDGWCRSRKGEGV